MDEQDEFIAESVIITVETGADQKITNITYSINNRRLSINSSWYSSNQKFVIK